MNRLDQANEYIYHTLEKLIEFTKNHAIDDQQKREIYDIIDDMEEARHCLYELKNEMRTHIS